MTRHILVTGVSGSGKSVVAEELEERGYTAYDIEEMDDLFVMVDGGTGEVIQDPDPHDVEEMERGEWLCEGEKLKELMRSTDADIAFYCGTASNIEEILPLFDEVLLLEASEKVLRQRLRTRDTNPFGNDVEVREWVLGYKGWWENKLLEAGATAIDADQELEDVVNEVLKTIT